MFSSSVPVDDDNSATSVVQNGSSQEPGSEATRNQSEPTTDAKKAIKPDQTGTKTSEGSTVSKTTSIPTPTSGGKIARITIPIANISSPPAQDQKNIRFALGNKQPQKIAMRSILSPTTTAQAFGQFKNTSSDGPKILNVSGGLGNIIKITGSVENGAKSMPVVLKQVSQNGTNCPPIFRAGATTKVSNSGMSVSSVNKGSVGPVYRISTKDGSQGRSSVAVKVSQLDPIEEEIRALSRKQIERKNPIGRFTMTPPPDDLEFDIDIPVGGYKCEECGDSYALESSLTHHMERRSVKILMNCTFCRRKVEFYNKCSMHAHVRKHKIASMNPVLDVSVTPLDSISTSSASRGRPKLDSVFKQVGGQEQGSESGTKPAGESLLQQARKLFSEKLPRLPSRLSFKLESLDSSKCPVCLVKVDDTIRKDKLRFHLHTSKQGEQFKCQHCHMYLANNCQLQLHIKIHFCKDPPPWLCPECGIIFKDYDKFEVHINQICLHFSRTASFQAVCSICKQKCKSISAYVVHLQSVHRNSFYKCLNCQLAFRTVDALKIHSSSQHNYHGSPVCSIISKCPLCDTVFTQHSMLESHLRTHASGFTPSFFQFVCTECKFVSGSGCAGLLIHYDKNHNKRRWWFCDLCLHKFPRQQAVRDHRRLQHPEYKTLPLKSTTTSENVAVHTSSTDQTKVESSSVVKAEGEEKKSTKVIIKRMLRCPGCKALGVDIYFKKEPNLRNHISRHHSHMDPNSIRPEFLEYVPFYPGGKGNAKVCDQEESGGTDVYAGHKRKRAQEAEASAKRMKKLKEDKLSCAKCDFKSKDRIAFNSHIEEHRGSNDVSQCQECGICFRVEDSLHKHLFVKHQIRDILAYAKFQSEVNESIEKFKAEQLKETKVEPERAVSPSNPLECNVCHKVFDSEVMKKNHMRSHGMAFIKSKNKTP